MNKDQKDREFDSQKEYFSSKFSEEQDCSIYKNNTLHELFVYIVKNNSQKDFSGTIVGDKISYMNYGQAYNVCMNYSEQLSEFVNDYENIGIISENRQEWLFAEQAIYMRNGIVCPLYPTMGTPAMLFIIDQANINVIYSSLKNLEKLKSVYDSEKFKVQKIICFDDFSDDLKNFFKEKEIDIIKITDSEKTHKIKRTSKIKEDDVSTICYTSGTTGNPKGAILTHKCFMSQLAFLSRENNPNFNFDAEETYFSYLPLAHVMERLVSMAVILLGGRVGFFSGDIKNIGKDIKIIRPTLIAGVPRVFNIFKDKVMEKVAKKNFILRWIFNLAVKYKIRRQKKGKYTSNIIDFFIFKKVKSEFGGNIKHVLSGSAPLNPAVCQFLQAVLSVKICEGYGSTECSAANILKPLDCHYSGTVGVPFPSNKVKLIPTVQFSGKNIGEIYIKGKNCFKGYYKNESETNKILRRGWVKTGDIGKINENGYFEIIGRAKEIFKLSIGEYIVPSKLEKIFESCADDVFITSPEYGDFLLMIAVSKKSSEEIMGKVKDVGMKSFEKGLISKFEIPRGVLIADEDFYTAGLLTPTNKKIRSRVDEKYRDRIIELHEQIKNKISKK